MKHLLHKLCYRRQARASLHIFLLFVNNIKKMIVNIPELYIAGAFPIYTKGWGMRISHHASWHDLDTAKGSFGESYRRGVVPDTLPHFSFPIIKHYLRQPLQTVLHQAFSKSTSKENAKNHLSSYLMDEWHNSRNNRMQNLNKSRFYPSFDQSIKIFVGS